MQLSNVKSGDIVEIDKKGRIFFALVELKEGQELTVSPINSGVTYRHASSREVKGHWSKRKN